MTQAKLGLLALYLRGFMLVFLILAIVSLLVVWVLQAIAMGYGETYAWSQIMIHLFLSGSFLALFAGQKFWTFAIEDAQGARHVIIGNPAQEQDQT